MKKMVLLLLFAGCGISAQVRNYKPANVEKDLEDAKVIRFSVTIYRNEKDYNTKAWDDAVQLAVKAIESGSKDNNDGAFIEDVIQSIRTMSTRSGIQDGVHGEIKVGIGDGSCSAACKDDCTCKKQYKGVCPCSAITGSTCKGETLVCADTHCCGHEK